MTDQVHPTQGEASSQITSGVIKNAGHVDWIVPPDEDYLAGFSGLSGTPLNGFAESHSGSSFDVTIDTGEAFVGGRWCARDVTTTVTLASSTSNQTIYLGWESSTANSVVIGLDSAFSSSDDGRRTAIWECDTDGSGVTSATKIHDNEPIHPHAENADALGGASESAFAKLAQNETVTGSWRFSSNINIDAPSGHVDLHESDTTTEDFYRMEVQSSDLYLQPWDASADTHINAIRIEPNGRVSFSGNVLAKDGQVRTRRGTAISGNDEGKIFKSDSAPTDTDGQNGDIWVEY